MTTLTVRSSADLRPGDIVLSRFMGEGARIRIARIDARDIWWQYEDWIRDATTPNTHNPRHDVDRWIASGAWTMIERGLGLTDAASSAGVGDGGEEG